jgi:hypothetical protein
MTFKIPFVPGRFLTVKELQYYKFKTLKTKEEKTAYARCIYMTRLNSALRCEDW